MSPERLEQLIEDETAASEATREAPISNSATRKGGAKSVIYSVRLTPEQFDEIQNLADTAGIPASALVRDWVVQGLTAERESSGIDAIVDALAKDVGQLKRRLAQDRAS